MSNGWYSIVAKRPPEDVPIEVGWHDQVGEWISTIARRHGDNYVVNITGSHIALPDWWKYRSAAPDRLGISK